MTTPSRRRGSVFLIALAVVTVMVILAYSLLAVARNGYAGARATNLEALSQLAARLGTAHADAVIARDFLVPSSAPATAPAVPATLNGAWRTAFLPIDTYRVGKATAATSDDRPTGEEGTAEDLNDNDVKVENLLTELYCGLGNGSHAGYDGRGARFRGGWYNHPGGGRYIEPGFYNSDLVGKPVSFHLARDPAALAADPRNARIAPLAGDPDPAAARGEAWGVDVAEPMWLDGELRPAASRAEARYRLRYAVAVEDLAGHLLLAPPGDFDAAVAGCDAGHVVSEAEALRTSEADPAVAARYADAFADMAYCARSYSDGWSGQNPWWAWLSFSGRGAVPYYDDGDTAYRVLRDFSSSPTMAAADAASWRIDARAGGDGTLFHADRGPAVSFEMAQNPTLDCDAGSRRTAYLDTPFGRAGRATAAPAAWDDGYTDTPWRVNLPTAVPAALRRMLYAYLPAEFHTLRVAWSKYQYLGGGHETKIDGAWIAHPNPHIDLFSPSGPFAATFAHLGAIPYPGSDPGGTRGPSPWNPELGVDIDVNDLGVTDPASDPLAQAWNAPSVIWGQDTSYLEYIRYNNTSKFSSNSRVGDTRNQYLMDDSATQTLTGDSDARWWFWYRHSYWLDLASAFAHAMAATQYAWMGRCGSEYESGDPATDPPSGLAAWPATWGDADPALAALAGRPCLDADRDGDGRPDCPSYLATVEQVDRQFLKNLGEWPDSAGTVATTTRVDYPTGSRPGERATGLVAARKRLANALEPARLLPFRASNNIKSLLAAGRTTPDQAALMELALNDMRMSFFGASPQYPGFAPLDFDDDGTVHCSCYAGTGTAPADPATGRGPVPAADRRFSLTGCFVFQKSRYYRVFCRGEVWDCLRRVPVAVSDLETVLNLDPAGEIFDVWDKRRPGAPAQVRSATLFQRWLRNRYAGAARRE